MKRKQLQYKIDHNRKIISEDFKGDITLEDYLEYQRAKLADPNYDDSYDLISDIRDVVFNLSEEENEKLYESLISLNEKINLERRSAIITKNPREVVMSELIKMKMSEHTPLEIRIFSTKEAAYSWLLD